VKLCVGAVFSIVVIAACGGGHVVGKFRMEGHGMAPTIKDGEQFDVIGYDTRSPARGDVIVFAAPLSPDRRFIKRIIALPGEAVEIEQSTGTVRVGGDPFSEPYVQGATTCPQACEWTIPEDGSTQARQECGSDRCYFVLGDNRPNSSDSRQGWLVPEENIVGYVDVE